MGEFAITFDADRHIVDVTISGVWDIAASRRYRQAIAASAPRAAPFNMIVDIRATTVLPANAAAEIEGSLADLANMGLRYAAHITTSALTAMQVRRIGSSHAVMAFFATRSEALDWLTASNPTFADQDIRR